MRAAIRFVKEAGVDMVKLDGASDHLDAVTAVTRAGIPVFAQFGITPQTALKYGVTYSATPTAADAVPDELLDEMVGEAKRLEDAGAALLNFTNSGPVVGAAVAEAVSIPVVGGFGGGPWLDGRMRMVTAAIGYSARRAGHAAGHLRQRRADRARRDHGATPTTCGRRARSPVGLRRVSVSTAVVDGIVTRYEVAGSGPPLLMFSPGGFDATLDSWETHGLYQRTGMLAQLRERFTCITFDKRESGQSGGRVERVALVGLRQPGRRAARPSGPRIAPTSWAPASAVRSQRFWRRLTRTGWPAWCCTRRPAGVKYRMKQHARFAAHLAYVGGERAGRRGRAGRPPPRRASPRTAGWGRG